MFWANFSCLQTMLVTGRECNINSLIVRQAKAKATRHYRGQPKVFRPFCSDFSGGEQRANRGGRYGIFSKNEYFYWMNNQIIFWMNEFFEWIFLILFWMNKFFEWIFWPYNWMNYWMNQKSALFIRKMNKKCLFWTERAPFACFSLSFTVFSSCDLFSNLNE